MISQPSNTLLNALSPDCHNSLFPRLKFVVLPIKAVLYEADETPKYAHFLTSGMASIVSSMSNGATAEVGICGREGMVETLQLLGNARIPTRCFMQVEGAGLRMPFKELQKEFFENAELRDAILRGVQCQSFILAQLAACNRLHEAEERLARWLLMVRDRVESAKFMLTQEFLATMLGSRRTTVTAAAGALQKKGFIRYSRGRIEILEPQKLENAACECYPTVRNLYSNLQIAVAAD
jgi:CRP-like cAMP-binding protein